MTKLSLLLRAPSRSSVPLTGTEHYRSQDIRVGDTSADKGICGNVMVLNPKNEVWQKDKHRQRPRLGFQLPSITVEEELYKGGDDR